MMKSKLLKRSIFILLTLLILILVSLTVNIGTVQAALQSNPSTHYSKEDTPTNWISNFRYMEATNGALGLKEQINWTSKVATSESNNLDSHMMRSTEYGCIAILSASGYGNPVQLQNSKIQSTTGNETGVYINVVTNSIRTEYVAGGVSGYVFSGVDGRYYDAYGTNNSSAKVGDALGTAETANPGCTHWHSANTYNWPENKYPYLMRNCSGNQVSLFSFSCGAYGYTYFCRGVVVCGEGL